MSAFRLTARFRAVYEGLTFSEGISRIGLLVTFSLYMYIKLDLSISCEGDESTQLAHKCYNKLHNSRIKDFHNGFGVISKKYRGAISCYTPVAASYIGPYKPTYNSTMGVLRKYNYRK